MKKLTGPLNSTVAKKGITIKGGPGGMQRGIAQAGKQAPGQTSQTKGNSNKKFAADAGPKNGMFGKQSVNPSVAGQTGKGGGGGGGMSGGKKKRGYGGDANGNPY